MSPRSRILVVDDEPAMCQFLLMILGAKGYQVESVHTGQEALTAAADCNLILLDLHLPDVDNTYKKLKEDPSTKHIPIVTLSVPVKPEKLLHQIGEVLRRRQVHVKEKEEVAEDIVEELKNIIRDQAITPYFQPIYLLNPMRLFGMEVLARPNTDGPLNNPETLFKVALRCGLYYEVEMIVWRKAIECAKKNFNQREFLFLNCSPYLIESDQMENVKAIFKEIGLDARRAFLELTERSAINEEQLFYDRLSGFRKSGFRIAIDDMGAGYASLEAIIKTRPEVVKIDREIVLGLTEDPFKRSIVKLIVAFCRENSIICIAEGIEQKRDLDMLLDLGVQAGQGYYLYKPTSTMDLNAMRSVSL
jgi:EAL domain-containing protein (putative c-di-GMP-specific phosphodiesterase class I)